jgi:hypothetical protein
MDYEPLKNEYVQIKNFVGEQFLPPFEQYHKEILEHINSYAILYSNWKTKLQTVEDKSEAFKITSELHRQIENNLEKQSTRLGNKLPFTQYDHLNKFFIDHTEGLDDKLVLDQEETHFKSAENDPLNIRTKKKIKSIAFTIGKKTTQILNKKEKQYSWKRIVPLRNLTAHYLLNNYIDKVLSGIEIYVEVIGKTLINILVIQKETDTLFINSLVPFIKEEVLSNFEDSYQKFIIEIDEIVKKLDTAYNYFVESINNDLDREFENINNDFNILGTIELPSRKFNNNKKISETNNLKVKLEKSNKNYENFISAVFDRKEYYEDLIWFVSLLIGNSYNIKKYIEPFIAKTIVPTVNSVNDQIKNSIKNIESGTSDLENVIENEKLKLIEQLDRSLIPSLLNKVGSSKLSDVLKDYLKRLEQDINEFEKNYAFVNPKSLVYRIKKEQLKEFSPKEIISPIVIKKLNNDTEKLLRKFKTDVSKLNSTIMGLGRIVEYNLDSAKIKLKEENSSTSESVLIANEGLLRAINKTEDYSETLSKSFHGFISNIENSVVEVLNNLISLSNVDRLITIKLQVSKEKAIEEGKERLRNYYSKAAVWFLWLKNKSLAMFSASKEKIIGISSKVGLGPGQIELSEAMADYLSRVSQTMDQIPYVYQRLFSNDQLTDVRIFVSRENEIAKLEKAITYWQNNQTSSVMLIGEKGSGTSSLINIAFKKLNSSLKVFREEFSGTIYKETDLLIYLKKLLKLDSVETTDQLIETLNNSKERIIVIIENIEDFFLRIVEGFEALNKLMEIITSTNSKVLWITTCNTYSWDYLRKVINVNDFFVFNIKLADLNYKIVQEIILSRHQISGYELEFLPTEEISEQKSFNKLTDLEKQEYMKKEFFENLTKQTSNNIAVALFIWLHSIKASNEEKIQVSSEIELDFSFLKSLSDQKLFSLMAILLHDGLSSAEHSMIFNISHKASQLLFASLSDDGIIFKRGNNYKVNFQLYKPIINLLKDKNILH